MKIISIILICLVSIVIFFGIIGYGPILWKKVFGVQYADADREVFTNTRTFTQGMKIDLLNYYAEWRKADKTGKKAIEATVRMQCSDYEGRELEEELKSFLSLCKYGNTN